MTDQPPETEQRVVNQTNHGSGTFVAGNVLGSIVNLFIPAQRRSRPTSTTPTDAPQDDYEDISESLVGAVFLAAISGTAIVYCIRGLPFSGTGPTPGIAERIVVGILFTYAFFACAAAFLARTAQGLEVWAGRCADITVQTRGGMTARLPAGMARALAATSSGVATTAALVAVFYGWAGFGASVQERAYLARDNAAMNASRARAAARKG
ncbi:hypothetical protein [Streptomyces goshikiensis]|uniref:hypothetical protein n=1 Tax=Streptomyces goshikiensis TaxID=1942 RepID=UPI002AE09FBB|nr:hypothetical protein [Streptomyces goshikiensis]